DRQHPFGMTGMRARCGPAAHAASGPAASGPVADRQLLPSDTIEADESNWCNRAVTDLCDRFTLHWLASVELGRKHRRSKRKGHLNCQDRNDKGDQVQW